MIYFDNAASGGRKPDNVLSALAAATKVCANPGRSGHKLALACAELVQDTRNALTAFFGGYAFDRVIFTKNCTEALNIALLGVLNKGDHVVTTPMEHNSVLRPLAYLQQLGIITYDVCPLSADGNVTPEDVARLIRSNTRMVAITAASNVTGATPPIEKIRKLLPKEILLLCDGAQGGGHIRLHMQEQGIDLLTLAGHKGLMSIQGSGALLFSERVNPRPTQFGGTGSLSISLDMPDFYPDALEAGTLSFPAIVCLLEGVRYVAPKLEFIQEQLTALSGYCIQRLSQMDGYKIFSKPNPCGIVSFAHMRIQSEQVAVKLSDEYGIAVRGGLHCAPLMHEALSTLDSGLVRASFSHFNDKRQIDELLFALERIKND